MLSKKFHWNGKIAGFCPQILKLKVINNLAITWSTDERVKMNRHSTAKFITQLRFKRG